MGKTLNIQPATTPDYRRLAEARLPRFLFDYIDGGANDERTLASNVDDFSRILIKQRVLRNVDHLDTTTTIAGTPADMPVVLAPVGMAGLFGRRGEVQGVRVANAKNIPFTLSTVGICPLEEIEAASDAAFLVPALHDSRSRRDPGTARTRDGQSAVRHWSSPSICRWPACVIAIPATAC